MKRIKVNKKELTKIKLKKSKSSVVGKRTYQKTPDPWNEIRLKLKPLSKAYIKFREKRRIAKQKEEQRRLKELDEQKLREEEALKIQEQEERRLKKEKKIEAEEKRKLKALEEHRLKEKRIKEEQEQRIKEEQIYKERLIKGEQERIKQLERVGKLREEERKLTEERRLKIESRFDEKKRLKDEKKLESEHGLPKGEDKIKLKKEKSLKERQNGTRLNGAVKWFNSVRGYGFIKREDKKNDIFVHLSAVKDAGLKYLREGEQLTFEVENTDRGPTAINLQKTS